MLFKEIYALKVSQPIGDFYVTKMTAEDLLKVTFSEALEYRRDSGKNLLGGSQRAESDKRLKEIADYIDSVEMAFPNSVVLAANYTPDGRSYFGSDEEFEGNQQDAISEKTTKASYEWTVEIINEEQGLVKIIIPTDRPLAAIIDGQHRIHAFEKSKNPERLDVEIPCSIFFGADNAYQAFLFATINGNQKKVDRSLALEQFGFNVEEERSDAWTPDKLAVFLARKLNMKSDSPIYRRIKVAPRDPKGLFKNNSSWYVSMATIVDGILNLISANPKRDRNELTKRKTFPFGIGGGRERQMLNDIKDNSPLRQKYLAIQDDSIYETVKSFFKIAAEKLWEKASEGSYIIKTVGILALFDLLKKILEINQNENDFNKYLEPLKNADFTNNYFQASGVGRSRLRKLMLWANGFPVILKNDEEEILRKILNRKD